MEWIFKNMKSGELKYDLGLFIADIDLRMEQGLHLKGLHPGGWSPC
jgi:hypothetical protein